MRRGPRGGLLLPLLLAAPVLLGLGYAALAASGRAGPQGDGRLGWAALGEAAAWRSVLWSAYAAAASTALATAAAVALALATRRGDPLARATRLAALLPLPVPHLVAAVGGVLVLGQSGLLARLAAALGWIGAPAEMPALVYDRPGVGLILSLAWKEAPFLALVAFTQLAGRGAQLEETARTHGATAWQAATRVTLPLLLAGLLPAMVAVFAFVLGAYEAPLLLGPSDPQHLAVLTLERHTDADLLRRRDAHALAALALALALLAVAAHEWAARREAARA